MLKFNRCLPISPTLAQLCTAQASWAPNVSSSVQDLPNVVTTIIHTFSVIGEKVTVQKKSHNIEELSLNQTMGLE